MDERQDRTKQREQETRAERQTPLLKVSLFGPFQLHWQVPSCMQETAWDSRTSARSLFKLLLCAPDRQAAKSLLAGILWPETDEEKALESLRSAVKVLRKVLCTATGEMLIEPHGNSTLLKLAEQRRLWVDTDAFETCVAQASRTTTPDEALALWQQARTLLQGEFLAEDQQYEWISSRPVKQRRQVLWMARSRMIRQLSDLYLQRGEVALAEEELEQHIVHFPTDQDALYRLLTLLEQQECFEQASILYMRTKRILEATGKQPTKHVRAVYERIQHSIGTLHQALPVRSGTSLQMPTLSGQPHESVSLSVARRSQHVTSADQSNEVISLYTSKRTSPAGNGSFDAVINMLQALSEQEDIPEISHLFRRQLLELGIATCISRLAQLDSKHISAIEREELSKALGESIADGWKLFHSLEIAQVLAIGQAQLTLLHQVHAFVNSSALPYFYAGVYSLIGIGLHFQAHDEEALQMYHNGYLASLATGNSWYIAQSLICQADSYHALRQYNLAIQAIEEALRVIEKSSATDETIERAKAHLLCCWADNALMLHDHHITQEKLDMAGTYIDPIISNEEFDRAAWLLIAGKYALNTRNYATAKDYFEEALLELPEHWHLRCAMTATGLAMAYARMGERDCSLAVAKKLLIPIKITNAQMTNRWFAEYLQQDLLGTFPGDKVVHEFVAETRRHLPQ